MTTAVLLDLVSVIDLKPYLLDLHHIINAAAGAPIDDPQSRPLKACGVEELKHVRQCLVENEKQVRLLIKHLSEAMAKLNKIQNMLQTRKRSRPESSTQEQASLAVASSGHMTTTTHGKVSSSTVPNHVSTRLEGCPSRSSSIIQRKGAGCAQAKQFSGLASGRQGEYATGNQPRRRRSSVKSEVSPVVAVANGTSDGERDHKWTAQHQRLSLDSSRSRPSEGHGYR
ncbi:unnamed protein product [Sphagnum tenellum]